MRLQKILLTTISSACYFPIQLALYDLKAYFLRHKNPQLFAQEPVIKISLFPFVAEVSYITQRILSQHPRVVGFSCYVWNISKILRVADEIKKADSKVKIILGGPEVSPRAAEILKREKNVDIVVRGEGEETFVELMESILSKTKKLSQIKGIAYRDKGRVFVNSVRPQIEKVDAIPSPYLAGLISLKSPRGEAFAVIETMRGCPYRCRYCYYFKDFSQVKYFSLERVEAELKWILKRKPSEVYIMDPTFNVDSIRAKKILRIFIKHNKVSRLHLELRAEKIDLEMAELLKQAGISKLEIGVQSVSAGTLKLIGRSLDRRVFAKKIALLNRKKIFYETQLIDALPGHTYAKIKEGVDWLIALHSPCITVMRLLMLPGTYLRDHARGLGIRYSRQPDYRWLYTNTLSLDESKKIMRLSLALGTLYNRRFLRHTLFMLKKELAVNYTDILEAWVQWHDQTAAKSNKNPYLARDFIEYICNRYNKSRLFRKAYRVFLEKDFRYQTVMKGTQQSEL